MLAVTHTHELPILPDAVRALGILKNYARNSALHHQDEPVSYVCFIQSGRAFATFFDIEGNETWVTEYSAGQFIGCESLFSKTPSECQITAKTPVTAILFSPDQFAELMNSHPDLNRLVIADLSRQVKFFTTQTLETHSLSMRGRIAAELKRMAKPIGREPDTHIIRPTPIFSELAQRLGSTRETVSRTVSSLVKKDVLERRTGALLVPDLEFLEAQIR